MKELYDKLLIFLDDPKLEDFCNKHYTKLTKIIKTLKIEEDCKEFNHLLELIIIINNNYHHEPGFLNKPENNLTFIKEGIQIQLTGNEIYYCFKKTYDLFYFLLKKEF